MNTRVRFLSCAVICIALSFGIIRSGHAWFNGAETSVDTNVSSRNDSSMHFGDGSRYSTTSGSYNRYDNSRYDNRQDRSQHVTDSFNTDNRNYSDNRQDRSIQDAYNDYSDHSDHSVDNSVDASYNEAVAGSKRVDSNDISVGGNIRNSILGNMSQTYLGTDLSSGINGSGNTIDARSINAMTLGDTTGAVQ